MQNSKKKATTTKTVTTKKKKKKQQLTQTTLTDFSMGGRSEDAELAHVERMSRLYPDPPPAAREGLRPHAVVDGLMLLNGFLEPDECTRLLQQVDANGHAWRMMKARPNVPGSQRRYQAFGPVPDAKWAIYKGADVIPQPSYTEWLAPRLRGLAHHVLDRKWGVHSSKYSDLLGTDERTMLLVNEYTPDHVLLPFHHDERASYHEVRPAACSLRRRTAVDSDPRG